MDYKVTLTWDNEAFMWIATSDDVPGLVLESNSYDALIERVKIAIPDLLEINNNFLDSKIKSRFTANAIMKQAGIDYHF